MKKAFFLFLMLVSLSTFGHIIPHIQTESVPFSVWQIIVAYLKLGFSHVIPLGFDHILFILGIFFLNANVKSVIIQCSVFTIAHTITLGLTASGYIVPIANIVEPIIALSIAFVALENLFHQELKIWRIGLVFLFGLVHGMGFALAIKEIGLPQNYFLGALVSFNIGVELAQILIIFLAYFLLVKWVKNKIWYRKIIVIPISIAISCIAIYWVFERVFINWT